LLHQDRQHVERLGSAGQNANHGDFSARFQAAQRLLQGAGAPHFDHAVDAVARPGAHSSAPFGCFPVVEAVVRSQSPSFFDLLVAGGGEQHFHSGRFGQLQCKQGYAAGALDHDAGTGRLIADGVPGGHGGARQAGCFFPI